jgi:hypothetical protein
MKILPAYISIPMKFRLDALDIYSYCQKTRTGLQRLMAGSRNFNLSTISRKDVMCLTEEAAKVSGIPYVMGAYREEVEAILNQ